MPYIAGHRDAGQTECPGNNVYKGLPTLRDQVRTRIGVGKRNTSTTLKSVPPTLPTDDAATFAGRLTTGGGEPVAGRAILGHIKPKGQPWRRVPVATTQPDGTFTFSLNPQRDGVVVAEFEGDVTLWRSQSKKVAYDVTPARR